MTPKDLRKLFLLYSSILLEVLKLDFMSALIWAMSSANSLLAALMSALNWAFASAMDGSFLVFDSAAVRELMPAALAVRVAALAAVRRRAAERD